MAIAILALALTSLVKMAGESANTLSYLEKKTYAQWVALNKVNQIKASTLWPATGVSDGQDDMAAHTWSWEMKVADTDTPDMRRLDLDVRELRDDEYPVYRITTFVHKP